MPEPGPPVPDHAAFWWDVFWTLDTSRHWRMEAIGTPKGPVFVSVPGSIPYESKSLFARDHGLDPEAFDLLLRYVGALDDEFVVMQRENLKRG